MIADQPVLLTVTTKTGRRHAIRSGAAPMSLPIIRWIFRSVRRFLTRFNPSKIILLETELWPSLMAEAFGRDIRIIQVSGRLSEKSLRRYRPFVPLFRPLLRAM